MNDMTTIIKKTTGRGTMKKAKALKRKILKGNGWIQNEFSYKKKKRIADDIRYLADMNPDFENLVFELGVEYLLSAKLGGRHEPNRNHD